MPIKIIDTITPEELIPAITRMFDLSARKIVDIDKSWRTEDGAPVFTVNGKYTTRGWTEWTQGFQFGSALLQFDATDDPEFLEIGRSKTLKHMAGHLTHMGVHDHGFNNVSTYGNLLRLINEDRFPFNNYEKELYTLALKVSGAVQAARWTNIKDGRGFIYSFNGPHSLFIDTIRSLRSLAIAHKLGHTLITEADKKINLLSRLIDHASTTAEFAVFYGEGRDVYDRRGRTAHESIFNINDGQYRCPATQQGYSPFGTWTRGLAWAICGFAEELEFIDTLDDSEFQHCPDKTTVTDFMLRAAEATADFYIDTACTDGIPIWDTGAPDIDKFGDFSQRPSDPFNDYEPFDSSAAAIAAQGLLRLGNFQTTAGRKKSGAAYRQAGLTVARTLFNEPYLSSNPEHQGLLLHSVYHRPRGWDFTHEDQNIPNNESSMWGDYHLRELALMILREAQNKQPMKFFSNAQ
ncbi:MAG: glycosyl hydrolase [Verrucomicrobia bacterium]|nr:glycosyl hydrolase [Verrucomicrobiota bacterium]MCF7707979.1 glycosyl hydrolase [Verrucomicrobiota bacterium]